MLTALVRSAQLSAGALACLLAAHGAWAADLGTIDGFGLRWDSTLRTTLGLRAQNPDAALLQNFNGDDGDRAFHRGLMTSRVDVFTDVTALRGNFGFNLSAQGWYDPVYYAHSANTSPATFNPISVGYRAFPADVRQLMGGDAELVDAFVKDRFSVAGMPVSLRVGRQNLLWGESLFFANNGIAAGQAPVDEIKALGAPLAEARELYLPVTQAVLRIEIRPGLAVEAYDQFEWRRDRLAGVASYFSTVDTLDQGGERLLLPGGALYRVADQVPHGVGQFGIALREQSDFADFGIYALRYHAKLPQPIFDTQDGTYRLVFPRGIEIYGISASTYAGDNNLAAEFSVRRHMPLVAGSAGLGLAPSSGGGIIYAAAYHPPRPLSAPRQMGAGFATGQTWHAQVSLVSQLAPSRWWQAARLQGEIAANDLIGVSDGHNAVQAGRTHFATSLQAVFAPQYFQVLPGLDVSVPVGVGYAPIGRSSIDGSQNAGTGTVSLGVSASFQVVWQGALAFTHFVGGAATQKLADRDFMSISLARTF